jgi:DnaK suppressor protein
MMQPKVVKQSGSKVRALICRVADSGVNPTRATKAVATKKAAEKPVATKKAAAKPIAAPVKPVAAVAKAAPVAAKPAAPVAKPKAASAAAPAAAKDDRDLVFGMVRPTITDKELLKSKEDDYMNKEQLNFFKFKLLETRSQILANASDTGEHLRENEVTTDPADRATQEEEYTLELRTRDRERKLLKKVERSLKMIDDGSYGWCEESGEPIGLPRLLARPTATLSLEAQERRERMQKLYG